MDEFDETTLRRLYDALSSDEPRPASDLGRAANLDAGRVKAAARALRRRGALVAGGDRTGYRRILPPPLDAAAVTAAVRGEVGGEIRRLDVVATTMDAARAWAAEGAPHGAVVLADAQTAGRGRQGRAWASPPQLGLYFSVILSPGRLPADVSPLSLLAGVAAAEACREAAEVEVGLKWPNDLVAGGAKVGGILVEAPAQPPVVIVGVGVNVYHCPYDFPAGFTLPATSLVAARRRAVSRERLAVAVLNRLGAWLASWRADGPAPALEVWRGFSLTLGSRVRVTEGDVVGTAVDVTSDGALVVEDEAGGRHVIHAGDVVADDA